MRTLGADERYQLVRAIGRGGMGEVHLAMARGAAGFEKLVAIKLLDERFASDTALTRGLLREAFLGVRLDHEHIVTVLDLGEEAGRYFIVMEYVRGYTLAHVLAHLSGQGRTLPIAAALHVVHAALAALDHVHQLTGADGEPLGLIHGDVSPSNLMLGADGRIKLADFGLATLSADLLEQRSLAGKLPYLPPEAFAGSPRAQGWDVYAAAALLYEALAGAPAFPGSTLDAVRSALRAGAPPLRDRRPDVGPELADVIAQALAFQPARRFRGIAELRAALDAAAPRQVGDARVHRDLVAALYADPGFVSQHGELPTSGGYSLELERSAPQIDTTEMAPVTVGRVRTRPLRVGMSPALGASAARVAGERLAAYLRDQLDRDVRPMVLADYAMVVDCLADGELDVAWLPPVSLVAATERGAGLLARIQRAGRTDYLSALIARADAALVSLDDLRGKSIAWVDLDSASGYLFAAAELRRRLGALDPALGEQHFVGSHRAVCEAVANGWAAAGATYASRDEGGTVVSSGWRENLGERAAMIRPLWFSRPIPGDSLVHRPFLPAPLVAELSTALLGMSATSVGRDLLAAIFNAEELVPPAVSDYDVVRDALQAG